MMKPHLITDAVNAQVSTALTWLETAEMTDEVRRDELLHLIADIEEAISSLRTARSMAEKLAVPLMPWPRGRARQGQRLVVSEVGVFRVKRKDGKVEWNHAGVAHAVVDAAWAAHRIDHPRDAADVLLEVAAVSYWRMDPLRELGIDPSEYRSTDDGPLTVVKEA